MTKASNKDFTSDSSNNVQGSFPDACELFSADFLTAFNSTASLIVIVDPYTYKIVFANAAVKRKFPMLTVESLCYLDMQGQRNPCGVCPLKSLNDENNSHEIRLNDGNWYLTKASPLYWNNRKFAIINYTDITLQKKAETALLERIAENSAVIEQSGKSVIRYSVKDRTAFFFNNCGKSFGLGSVVEHFPNDALKTRLVSPESYDDVHYFFESINLGVPEGSVNARLRLIDSQERWFHADYSLCFEDDEAAYCIISFFDNTDTRERELAYEIWQTDMIKRKQNCVFYIDANLSSDTIECVEGKSVYLTKEGVGDSFSALVSVGSKLNVYYEDNAAFVEFLEKRRLTALYNLGVYSDSLDFRATNGGIHWQRAKIQMVRYPYSEDIKIYVLFTNVDGEHREKDRLVDMATCDSMTRLLNREATMQSISDYISGEGANSSHALFMIDIDNFKSVNDTFGHQAGDNVIVGLASSLKSCFRASDILGRIGGDEFFAFMKNASISAVKKKAGEVVNALQMIYNFGNNRLELSASIGISLYDKQKTLEQLYTEADKALYCAKAAGKNCYSIEGASGADQEILTETDNMSLSLRTLLNDIDVGIALYRSQGAFSPLKTVFCNEDIYTVLGGLTSAEYHAIYDGGLYEGLFPDDRNLFSDSIALALHNKTPICLALRLLGAKKIYYWVNVSARLLANDQGGVDIYAIYTPINHQTEKQAELAESRSKIIAAIRRADISFWQYDIQTGTAEVIYDDFRTIFLEGRQENFAQSLTEKGYMTRESVDDFIALHNEINSGARYAERDVQRSEEYGGGWYRISYHVTSIFDGKPIRAIGTARNINELVELKRKGKLFKSLGMLLAKETAGVFCLNLTKNLYINGDSVHKRLIERRYPKTADGFFETGSSLFETPEEYAHFYKVFSRENLLTCFKNGQSLVSCEFRYKLYDDNPIWLQSLGEMTRNAETGDIELFISFFDNNDKKKTELAYSKLFKTDYEFIGLINVSNGILTQLISRKSNYNGQSYSKILPESIRYYIRPEVYEDCLKALSLPNLLNKLSGIPLFTCTFRSLEVDGISEGYKQWRFSYLDEQKNTILITRTDITKTVICEKDELTGLLNRQGFYRQAQELLHAFPDVRHRIIRFDFDNFKMLNESLGTNIGDKVLRDLGKHMEDTFRNCLSARIEADHFVIICPSELCDPDTILQKLTMWQRGYKIDFVLSYHIGVFDIDDPSMEINVMCDRALVALKSIKHSYTTRIAYYNAELNYIRQRQQSLASEMVSALENGEFVVHFQPIINFETKRTVGAEALVRWQHRTRGLISPADFIPLFEQNGFISNLDEYVFEQSCKFLAKLKEQYGQPPIYVSVNVSRIDLYNPNLCTCLSDILVKYGLDYSFVKLEITESACTRNPEQLLDAIHRLKNKGFSIEMDDFGSGYSSLNILKDMPVDVLKMDSRFLSQGVNTARGGSIIASVIRMAHWIGIPVIAEGIETADQAEYLSSLGCLQMQGFHFAKPMPQPDLEELLQAYNRESDKTGTQPQSAEEMAAYWDPSSQNTLILNSFVDGAAIIECFDNSVEVVRANKNFYTQLGTNCEDFSKHRLSFATFFLQPSDFLKLLKDAEENAEADTELKVTIDNKLRWIFCRLRLLAKKYNRKLFYLQVEDCTRKKSIESHIATVNNELKLLLDSLGSVINYYDIPTRTLRLSVEYARKRGLPTLLNNFPNAQFCTVPEDEQKLIAFYADIENGKKSGSEVFHFTFDGKTVSERHSFFSLFDENNNPYISIINAAEE